MICLTNNLSIALAQLEPKLGDIEYNISRIVQVVENYKADLYVFPELFLVGYTSRDLITKLALTLRDSRIEYLRKFAMYRGIGIIVGFPEKSRYGFVYNSILAIDDKGSVYIYRKRHLPTFSVFDEHRWFRPYRGTLKVWNFRSISIGLGICYDIFFPEIFRTYTLQGAKIHIVISASPDTSLPLFHILSQARALENTSYFVWVNMVGFSEGLGFAGGSRVCSPLGEVILQLKRFEEEVRVVKIDLNEVDYARELRPVVRDLDKHDAIELLKAYNEFEYDEGVLD